MAVTETRRGNKRRKLSPAEEDPPQRAKRNSEPKKDDNIDTSTNHSDVATAKQVEDVPIPSVKGLDSSEPAIRRSTLKTILENLQSRASSAPLSATQCLQLWRGFFVAIYMHDSRNALSVQNLLREIATTFSLFALKDDETDHDKSLSTEDGTLWLAQYHSAFWETLTREWATIDSHRMNKYLLLVRFVLRELFTICLKGNFELDEGDKAKSSKSKSKKGKKTTDDETQKPQKSVQAAKACINILETAGPLNLSQRKISDGLRLHVLDVWSDELFGALAGLEETHPLDEGSASSTEQRVAGIVPVLHLFQQSVEKVSKSDSGAQRHVRLRAKDAMKAVNEQMEDRSWQTSV